MTEDLNKILENAERFMKKVRETERFGGPIGKLGNITYWGIRALYEQNKAIVELLKNYKR